jgi:hypothetical protein
MTPSATYPSSLDLRELLTEEHRRLEALFDDLLSAFAAGARNEQRGLWRELDAALAAEMELEERLIFPAIARSQPEVTAELLRDHAELRQELIELGVCVERHALDPALGKAFIARLREHARREEPLLDQRATAQTSTSRARALLARLRAAVDLGAAP